MHFLWLPIAGHDQRAFASLGQAQQIRHTRAHPLGRVCFAFAVHCMAFLKILIQSTNKLFQLIYNLTGFNFRLLDGFLQRQGCHTGDAAGRDAQTVIGIGAGADTDGQVLVVHDMLGMVTGRKPRFVKDFLAESGSIKGAIEAYVAAVRDRSFPAEEHTFKA